MGLIAAGLNAAGGVLADQWVDFITCDSLDENVLMAPGKKARQARSSNTRGSENILSNGSKINVADGQCLIIVENGKVADFCAEPGQYVYNNTIAPSLLGGGLQDLKAAFQDVGRRFAAGGAPANQQLVYYVNTKEIINNKIGWGRIPFRHYDPEFDKSIVVQVQGFGMYTFRIVNPLLFYKNLAGNTVESYTKEALLSTMKAEVMSALNPALGKIAATKIPYDELVLYPQQLGVYVNETFGPKWGGERGIEIRSFAVESITVDGESAKKIAQLQETAIHTDAAMAAARLVTSQANAMEKAAENQGGAVNAFIGMNMAQGAGGVNAAELFRMAGEAKAAGGGRNTAAEKDGWICGCGAVNGGGKFCSQCGGKRPDEQWVCGCGTLNKGKFCGECGNPRPAQAVCSGCGWIASDGAGAPKFCPQCGNRF